MPLSDAHEQINNRVQSENSVVDSPPTSEASCACNTIWPCAKMQTRTDSWIKLDTWISQKETLSFVAEPVLMRCAIAVA